MADETTEIVEAPADTVAETTETPATEPEVVVEQELNDDGTPKAEEPKEEPAVEKFEPWKKETKVPETVPYDRFSEVNRERRHFEEELAKAQAKVDELTKASAPKAEALPDPDALDPADYPGFKAYMTAYSAAVSARVLAQAKQQFAEQETEKHVKVVVDTIQRQYSASIDAACKEAPDIAEDIRAADLHLGEVSDKIHPVVLRELMTDPNAALVMHAIATNKAAYEQLIGGDPVTSIKMIGQASAFISARQHARRTSPPSAPADDTTDAKVELASTLPKPIRAQPTARKNAVDMSQKEYERWANKHFK